MRITAFSASKVQGHLAFDINFRPDFTFLIGLNGSGKTSALRLMMALLTPDLPELAKIRFETANLSLIDGGKEREIFVRKSAEGIAFGVSGIESSLLLSAADLQLLELPVAAGEGTPPVLSLALNDPVCQYIIQLTTPMFLGIDRRFTTGEAIRDHAETRRRDFLVKRSMAEESDLYKGNVSAGLADVNVLVHDALSEIRSEQEKLDDDFRNKLLTSAFDYKPVALSDLQEPSTSAVTEYQTNREVIQSAIETLKLPTKDVGELLEVFFDRMNSVAEELQSDKITSAARVHQSTRKRGERFGKHEPPTHPPAQRMPSRTLIEWMINKPQVERITAHLALLTSYNEERASLRLPVDRFITLLNQFLKDTNKRAYISERATLMVELPNNDRRSIGALSSGERQLVVMLGHLSLNKQLPGSGVFIVDEPELSLHISWQQRFVDAIREANPDVQIVMATHSPAVILDRDSHCESLDKQAENAEIAVEVS
ncbi:MAG: AAA family ATPase [Pseudomonadota bacterium]